MRILLRDNTTVHVSRESVQLSQFLKEIRTPAYQCIEDHLKKKAYRTIYKLAQQYLAFDLNEVTTTDRIKTGLRAALNVAGEAERAILSNVLHDVDTIFQPVAHKLPFLSDDSIRLLAAFLAIEHTSPDDTMFDALPQLWKLRSYEKATSSSLADIVDPSLRLYIVFIESLSDEQLIDVARTSCVLQIHSLSILVGCRLSVVIPTLTDAQFRHKYAIPDNFKHSVYDRINELYNGKTGASHVPSPAVSMPVK